MPFDYGSQHLKGLTIFAFYGNSYHSAESLSGSGTDWQFSHTPVCQRGLRLMGTGVSGTGFILNYELEPISGQLTTPAPYSSVTANYYHYSGSIQFILEPETWDPAITRPTQRRDIWGGSHANVPNVKPASVSFNVVRTTPGEQVLTYIADMVITADWFILMDAMSGKAYEGNLLSNRVFSVDKGYEPFIPFELLVESFGSFDPDGASGSGVIDWKAFEN